MLRGRAYLVLFFLLLQFYHVWIYFTTEPYARQELVAHEAPLFVITAALYFGVACRQNWARYLLIAFTMFRVGATLIFLPAFIEPMMASNEMLFRLLTGPVLDAVTIWGLISIPSIRRLVSRTYE